jgi:hypothetical protein
MFTPTSHDGLGPLAHRILCAIKKEKCVTTESHRDTVPSFLDVSVQQRNRLSPNIGESFDVHNGHTHYQSTKPLNQSFSAVCGLPVALVASIGCKDANNIGCDDSFLRTMLSRSEDLGKSLLKTKLLSMISHCGAVAPPTKKRGLGAEMLAYVSSLLSKLPDGSSRRSIAELREGYQSDDISIHEASNELLSWAVCVIEAMQRSSSKQLEQHMNSFCSDVSRTTTLSSFDLRNSRDVSLFHECCNLRNKYNNDPDIMVNSLLRGSGVQLDEGNTDSTEVLDIKYLFLSLIRYVKY